MSTHKMPGLQQVDCRRCGRRHALSAEQARVERVVRCACGQFIRMDRALPERRSEPAPAKPAQRPATTVTASEGEQARLIGSHAEVSSVSGRARATQVSLSGHERPSSPPRAMPSAASRSSSAPPSADKPLWYVDLGGAETVEMTIEQLIIARRSGKLGEGALVWRAGMARWRPVGELIPASSSGRPAPPSPAPTASAANTLGHAVGAPASALGSYERPLATLEFALESPISATPREPSKLTSGSLLSRAERASQPPRAPTPIPQRAPTPVPQRAQSPLPQRRPSPLATPLPPIPSPPAAPPVRPPALSVAALATSPGRSVISTVPVTVPLPRPEHIDLFNEGPRWRTLSLALLLSIGASGSGAFLVRALRSHHQAPALAPAFAPALPATSLAGSSAPSTAVSSARAAAEPPPRIVALSSLSIERAAPRPPPRAVPATPTKASEFPADAEEGEQTEPAASVKPKPKNSDSSGSEPTGPAGAAENGNVKKQSIVSGDESGL